MKSNLECIYPPCTHSLFSQSSSSLLFHFFSNPGCIYIHNVWVYIYIIYILCICVYMHIYMYVYIMYIYICIYFHLQFIYISVLLFYIVNIWQPLQNGSFFPRSDLKHFKKSGTDFRMPNGVFSWIPNLCLQVSMKFSA